MKKIQSRSLKNYEFDFAVNLVFMENTANAIHKIFNKPDINKNTLNKKEFDFKKDDSEKMPKGFKNALTINTNDRPTFEIKSSPHIRLTHDTSCMEQDFGETDKSSKSEIYIHTPKNIRDQISGRPGFVLYPEKIL